MIKDKDAVSLAKHLLTYEKDLRLLKFRVKDFTPMVMDAYGLHVRVNTGQYIDEVEQRGLAPNHFAKTEWKQFTPERIHTTYVDPHGWDNESQISLMWDKRSLLIQDISETGGSVYRSTFTTQYLPTSGLWGCLVEFPLQDAYPFITRRDWLVYFRDNLGEPSHLELYWYDDPYTDTSIKEVPQQVQGSLI